MNAKFIIVLILLMVALGSPALAQTTVNDGSGIAIDTVIKPLSFGVYSFGVTQNNYKVYFRNDSNTANAVRFEKNGYVMTYDLSGGQMRWAATNTTNATDTLGSGLPSNSLGTVINVAGNRANYPSAFYNTTLSYEVTENALKETFILSGLYTVKNYKYLEYSGMIDFNASLKICTDSQCFVPSGTQDDFETNGTIYFKDAQNNVIFYLPAPTAVDSLGHNISLTYSVHGSNAHMNFWLRLPKTFIDNAITNNGFPIVLDPTVVVATGLEATTNTNFVTRTINGTQIWSFGVSGGGIPRAYLSTDGGNTWSSAISAASGVGSSAVDNVGNNIVMYAGLVATFTFNMSRQTWSTAGGAVAGIGSLAKPYRLANGNIVTYTGGGASGCDIQLTGNLGVSWSTVTAFSSPFNQCDGGYKAIVQTPDGYVWVMRGGIPSWNGTFIFNVSNSTWATPTSLILVQTDGAQAGALAMSPNGTIYGYAATTTNMTYFKISDTTKAVLTKQTILQPMNVSSDAKFNEGGNLIYDVATKNLYYNVNNGTGGNPAGSRMFIFNVTNDGMSWNTAQAMVTFSSERAYRGFIGGGTRQHPYFINSTANSTVDIVYFNASTSLIYSNFTIISGAAPLPPNSTSINITSPSNTTYLANNVTISFNIVNNYITTYNCWKTVDGNQTNLGSGFVNATQYNTGSGDLMTGSHTVNVTCQDSTVNQTNWSAAVSFTTQLWKELYQTYQPTAYETNTSTFTLRTETAGNIQDAEAILKYNSISYVATHTQPNATTQLFTYALAVPLVDVNNTVNSFNWTYNFTFSNTSISPNQLSNTTQQTVLWTYFFDNVTSVPLFTSELQNVTFLPTMFHVFDNAAYAMNVSFNGANYTSQLIFNFGDRHNFSTTIIMPSITAELFTHVWNATLYVTFGGVTKARPSVNRNLIESDIRLVACNASTIPAMNFSYWLEETRIPVSSAGLASDADRFEANFVLFVNTVGDLGNATFTYNFTGAPTYALCLPNTTVTVLKTNADIRYTNTSMAVRFYYLRSQPVTPFQTFKLFMLESAVAYPQQIILKEANGVDPATNVVVQVSRRYESNGSYDIVAMGLTDANGKSIVYVRLNDVVYKMDFLRSAVLLKTTTDGIFDGQSATYSLTTTTLAQVLALYNKVQYSCVLVGTNVQCLYTDTSGTMRSMTLTVSKYGAVAFTQVCTNSSTQRTATVLNCNVASSGNGTFWYSLTAVYPSTTGSDMPIQITADDFRFGSTNIYGANGLLFAFILIVILAMLGSFNPVVCVMMATAGLGISVGIGFVDLGIGALMSIVMVAAILAFKMRS